MSSSKTSWSWELKEGDAGNFLLRRPGFAERWALLLFLVVLTALFAATWFIRYPELIALDATLVSDSSVKATATANMYAGQKVQVRFDAYPYREFGFVEGKIIRLNGQAELLIGLPNGLVTSHHKNIPYSNGLKAQVLIVVNNTRLLERLVDSRAGNKKSFESF